MKRPINTGNGKITLDLPKPPESVTAQWDTAFAAARTRPGTAKALTTRGQKAVAASWNAAFARSSRL